MLERYAHISDWDFFSIFCHYDHAVATLGWAALLTAIRVRSTLWHCPLTIRKIWVLRVAAVPVGKRGLGRHVLSEPWDVARPVRVLQSIGHLRKLSLLVRLKHVQLSLHPIDQLLLLLIQSTPSLIRVVVLLSVNVKRCLVHLQHIMRLISLQNHSWYVTLQVADGLLSLLFVEIGLIVALDLLK